MKRIITLTAILVLFTLPVGTSRNNVFAKEVESLPQIPAVTILYVEPGGSGACTSWVDACDLQTALAAADAGVEIWIHSGVYKPTAGPDRLLTFSLESGVALYGGFNGTENNRNQRDWDTNISTLSGDIGVTGDISDNSYHVVTGSGTDATAILDGFTITGGNANGGSYADFGGGMYNSIANPTVRNIIFTGNSAIYGGGMLNHTSNPELKNIVFSGNNAGQNGGGLYNYLSNPSLQDITFSDNNAVLNGGGMNNTASSPILFKITFTSNSATYGGAMYSYESNPTLNNVTFSTNSASQDGGGMHNYSGAVQLTNVTFTDNTAGQFGGGMYNNSSSPTLTGVNFSTNTATARGGGMYNHAGSNPSLTNVRFSGNHAATEYGGGIFNYDSSPGLVNVTFTGNFAGLSGGGMYNYLDDPSLINITFAGNSAPGGGGGVYNNESSPSVANIILWDNSPDQMVNIVNSTPVISYSDIQGGCPAAATCTQVIDVAPQFIHSPSSGADGIWGTPDDDHGDLGLQITSPAIDAGDNTAVPTGVVTDLAGNPRFVDVLSVPDTGNGMAPIVDMGAYETYPEIVPPTVVSILRADPSPTNAASVDYTVTFSESVTGVDESDFALTLSGISGATVAGVSGGSAIYTVAVSTGIGSGTLRLDVPGTASVTDLVGNPLIDIPYTGGESYSVDKIAPTVVSVLRASPSPTNAASVNYLVTFSEAVIGVGTGDFTLTLSGITGAEVTGVSGGPFTYTVGVSTGTGNGTLQLNVAPAASIADLVGNSLTGLPYPGGEVYMIDKTAPTVVSILRVDPSPTNAASVDYTVTFSEAVTGVGVNDFTLALSGVTGATVNDVSGGPTLYTVEVSTGTGDGTLRLDVPGTASISDVAGNSLSGLPYTGEQSYTFDRTSPAVVSILRSNPSPTNAASVNYTVTFSEAVMGVGTGDFTLTLSGISDASVTGVSGGPATYTVAVTTGTGSGTLRLDIPGTALIMDAVGNALSGLPYPSGEVYTIDKTAPAAVSILRVDPSPTNAEIVGYKVTFSEAVMGVGVSDFSLTVVGIQSAYVTGVSGGPTEFAVTVDTGRRNGTLRLDIPATASITDSVGNALSGLPYTGGEIYTIDREEPTVISILRAGSNPTNASSVNYTVTFSEAVTNVDTSNFTLTLSGITDAAVTEVSGGPTTFTIVVSTGTGDGTIRLDVPGTAEIFDLAGNELSELPYTSGELYTVDKTAPSVLSILQAGPDPTNAGIVDFTVTFSEEVAGVDSDDFLVIMSGITEATVSSVSGGPTIYTVAVSTGTGDGTLRLDVPDPASIIDMAGNTLSGLPYTAGETYTIDKTAPLVVSIVRAGPNPTNASSVDFTVTFSEAVSGVDIADFSIFTTGTISGSNVTHISGTGSIYTVTVSIDTGGGTLRLDIPDSSTISDLVGNPLSELPYKSGETYSILWMFYLPSLMKSTP